MMENKTKSESSTGGLIVALIIFLLIAGGGAVGYLYFFGTEKTTPKEHNDFPPPPPKPVEKGEEVPMPDAGSSQPQQQEKEITTPAPKEEIITPAPKNEDTSDNPMRITADVVQPVLIHKVNPEYPEIARKARIQGVVIMEAVITKEGTIEDVKVLRGVHKILDQAAVNSVKQWRYKPATLNGQPVKVYSTVTVKFTLK
jgi:TonB family protein